MLERKWLYRIVGVAAIAVIATAGGIYLKVASRADSPPAAMPQSGPAGGAPGSPAPMGSVPSMDVVAERLAQRLKANDGSADDWALLARSFVQMKRYPDAVDAFGKALQKAPGNQAFTEEQAAARKAAAEGAAPPK